MVGVFTPQVLANTTNLNSPRCSPTPLHMITSLTLALPLWARALSVPEFS